MRLFIIILLNSLFPFHAILAQVYGTISDENGELLPFVNVYIEGTGVGTSSNEKGEYELSVKSGLRTIVYQQIGFEKKIVKVEVGNQKINYNIQLKSITYELSEAVFIGSREDPAYPIIRKAIEGRKKYEKTDSSYQCEAYAKGMLKMLNAPEKVLGQKVGNLGGNLDSTKKGVLYLSESVSKLQFEKGKMIKELMISSKVAGNDRGFSFNRAGSLEFNMYSNTSTFGRAIISPIADYALSHYKYKLRGSHLNTQGHLIHKIELIPKVKADAAWNGFIYIQDSTWSIYEFDGFLLGGQIKQDAFDTVFLTQQSFYLPFIGHWLLSLQNFSFSARFLGFVIKGNFLINYSDFINSEIDTNEDRSEVLEIQSGSNKKENSYWENVRPIPLTEEEKKNYSIKDSIRIYKDSRACKDSMDKVNNQFEKVDLLLGYNYSQSYKRRYFEVGSLLNSVQFNTIQGGIIGAKINYEHYLDSFLWNKKYTANFMIDYGFSDQQVRSRLAITKYLGNKNSTIFRVACGRVLSEFAPEISTNLFLNQIYSLFYKNNVLKLFERDYIELKYARNINYNTRIQFTSSLEQRSNVFNNTNYSFWLQDRLYTNNTSTRFRDSFLFIKNKDVFQSRLKIIYQPKTKVWKTPNGIQKLGSEWPVFTFQPTINYYTNVGDLNFNLLASIDYNKDLNRWGELSILLTGVKSLGAKAEVPDAIHPGVNPFVVTDIKDRISFKGLRSYRRIAYKQSFEMHVEHNFQGLLFDRIYLWNKLGFTELVGFSVLATDGDKWYSEFSFGIGNIGYKIFRYFRVHWVKTHYGVAWGPAYLRVGVSNVFSIGN